jgi:hypothetical protein
MNYCSFLEKYISELFSWISYSRFQDSENIYDAYAKFRVLRGMMSKEDKEKPEDSTRRDAGSSNFQIDETFWSF